MAGDGDQGSISAYNPSWTDWVVGILRYFRIYGGLDSNFS